MLFLVMLLTACEPASKTVSDDVLASPEFKNAVAEAVAEKLTETEVVTAGAEVHEQKRLETVLAPQPNLLSRQAWGGSLDHALALDNLTAPEKLLIRNVAQNYANDQEIRLTGLAVTNQVLSIFMKKLEESAYFTEVLLLAIDQTNVGDVMFKEFSISAKLVVPGNENATAPRNKRSNKMGFVLRQSLLKRFHGEWTYSEAEKFEAVRSMLVDSTGSSGGELMLGGTFKVILYNPGRQGFSKDERYCSGSPRQHVENGVPVQELVLREDTYGTSGSGDICVTLRTMGADCYMDDIPVECPR